MRILLVRPRPERETIGLQHVMVVEPLELEVLGALRRDDDEVVLLDMSLETRPFEDFLDLHQPELVCVTGYITNVGTMIEYCSAAKARSPKIWTAVGGVHCEVCPEDLDHPNIDYRVVRNPVTVFPLLLDSLDGHTPLPPGVLESGETMIEDTLPAIDFSYVKPDRSLNAAYRDRYFYVFHDRVALLKTSFGCPYTCQFCFCREITRGHYRQRPIADTIEELESIPQDEIYVVDDDFLADATYLEAFLDELERRQIDKRYLVYGRADFVAGHRDLIARFTNLGLRTIIIGFESFSARELQDYGKRAVAEANRAAMRILNQLGVDCYATMILGPDWGTDDFRNLEAELRNLDVRFVNLQPLTPLPGTRLAVDDEDLLIDRSDHPRWDLAHLSLCPTRLSATEYYREILRLYRRILFRPRVLLGHMRRYPMRMIWRVLLGARRVDAQYRDKIREAAHAGGGG